MPVAGHEGIAEHEYQRRIRAWAMYDWANSAFSTTILAAVLPVYYSRVAGSTLASESIATAYWTIGLSIALFTIAILSPILGTISDLKRGKKPFLTVFAGLGVVATGLLVLVGSGNWLLASILFVLGRIGFGGANVFYDALLPHVARDEDQDRVSSLGYAIGYVGGGILLVINTVMIFVMGEIPGSRLSFLTVAIWWAVFTIPVLRRVPEPPAAAVDLKGKSVVRASFSRLRETFGHLRRYKELLKFLIAFLIYNDGIGTIIGVAAIYGAELGFGAEELILALVMVQFAAFPFTLAFGRIPGGKDKRAPVFLAFVVLSLILLPVIGGFGARALDADVVGRPGPDFETVDGAVGMGEYEIGDSAFTFDGAWTVAERDDLSGARNDYAFSDEAGDRIDLLYNGREIEVTYSWGPDHGEWTVEIDGRPVRDDDDELLVIDGYNEAARFEERETVDAGEPGRHVLSLINAGTADPDSTGTVMGIGEIEVLEPTRESSLGTLFGLLLISQVVIGLLALLIGPRVFTGMAARMDTKRTILLALAVYAVIAMWGFVLDTVIEFWFIAWMVSIVQGGSQALSRSLYASMSPASMSGEFFGFFSIMAKFSAFIGPIVFAGAIALFGNSRPAVLAVVVFFIVGGYLLTKVDVDEGRRVAKEADRTGEA